MELFNESPFNKLPIEIIYIILSYTYQPQSKELTEDIKNYYESKQIIFNKYYTFWIVEYQGSVPSDKEWLINDLYRYYNKDFATIYGYIDEFYELFFRKFNIQTKEQVNNFISVLDNKSLDTQINVLLTLLNPKERNEFTLINFN